LWESVEATFERLRTNVGVDLDLDPTPQNLCLLQDKKIDLRGLEDEVAAILNPQLLAYNDTWDRVDEMLRRIMSHDFRTQMLDSFGGGWVYNWHCVDHVGYSENPRRRDIGFHNIFDHYRVMLKETASPQDGVHFHYHPMPFNRRANCSGTHWFAHGDTLFTILARRIIDRDWFPCTHRPGFHVERPDSHWFLEQHIPFDYANQSKPFSSMVKELQWGHFGDWRRAPQAWRPYHPSHDDYQLEGACRRWIARCLNVGTWFLGLEQDDVDQAFAEARDGSPVILSFTDHDFRDMAPDVQQVRAMLWSAAQRYPDVQFKFCEAREAMRSALGLPDERPCKIDLSLDGNRLVISSDKSTFGPQPFLAVKTKAGQYYHDNLDAEIPYRTWSYVLDKDTVFPEAVEAIGVGACDAAGNVTVSVTDFLSGRSRHTYP
jgi:hypothetical protein